MSSRSRCGSLFISLAVTAVSVCTVTGAPEHAAARCSASSSAPEFEPSGAIDGDRFGVASGKLWKGRARQASWSWQVVFAQPREIGAILQVVGDHPLNLSNAPRTYVWQCSTDAKTWTELPSTRVRAEKRMYRLFRLREARRVRGLRMTIAEARGDTPALREVEFFAEQNVAVDFPDWIIEVRTTVSDQLSDGGSGFTKLARQCKGWERVPAQQVWKGDFNEAFLAVEPQPLCAFLSGNYRDWCDQPREPWRGVQEVLEKRNVPIWAACGGAQALAILSTVGVDKPWDCPRCRDPRQPKTPVYTHIGHTGKSECGVYKMNVGERGDFNVLKVADDPVLKGLPRQFSIHESHVGQIEFVPDGWTLIATRGKGAKTRTQCMRLNDRYIYAAQFHMETFATTLDASRTIMGNFLQLAKAWGGYNTSGRAVALPKPMPRFWQRAKAKQGQAGVIQIVLVGDSTVCDYPPERKIWGWGQLLPEFVCDDVAVLNQAMSGRSSKSFIKEGRWRRALGLRPDYVFIQFGHNDCPGKGDRTTDPATSYQRYLRQYVGDARKAGATPILVTPMTRRRFGPDGKIASTLRPYAEAMIQVARQTDTPVIDLHAKSVALLNRLGDGGSADLSCAATDRTHFSEKGARAMARLVVEDLPKVCPELIPYLVQPYRKSIYHGSTELSVEGRASR